MASAEILKSANHVMPEPAGNLFQPRWFAAYTCANHEKRVAQHLVGRGLEHFLPLYESVRRWKDRKVRLQLALFPSYVFVRLALRERLRVLQVPGVVRLVGFGEYPTPLPEEDVEILRNGLAAQFHAQPHPFMTVGRRVRVSGGPLAGLEGVLLRRKGKFRLVLSINLIMRSIVVDVDAADILPLASTHSFRRAASIPSVPESVCEISNAARR